MDRLIMALLEIYRKKLLKLVNATQNYFKKTKDDILSNHNANKLQTGVDDTPAFAVVGVWWKE